MKILQAKNKAKALLEQEGLGDWSVFTNDSSSTVAKVDLDRKRLTYSSRYIKIATEDEFYRTTMHEIAHALLPFEAGHGDEFIEKCRDLNPDQPYDLYCISSPIQRYELKCPECGFSELSNSTKKLYCPKCSSAGRGVFEYIRSENVLEEKAWASIS